MLPLFCICIATIVLSSHAFRITDKSESNIIDEINMLHYADADEANQDHENNSCLYEGVRYGPGSAMMSSRRCEYCYCIGGNRRCIRPKCLLSLSGCRPQYSPHSCCPVSYDCDQPEPSTTLASISENGCRIGGRVYKEGEMIRDIKWKAAACDNCFCAMGAIRCVPLACAPPLQGCTPIVREGQCCPSTYNCSCSIQVKAFQNYASYAFISKDYAKLRKETNFFPIYATAEGRRHRVNDQESSTSGSPNDDSVTSTQLPIVFDVNTETMVNEVITQSMDYTSPTVWNNESTTTPLSTVTSELTATTNIYNEPSTTILEDSLMSNALENSTHARTVSDHTTSTEYSTVPANTKNHSLTEKTTNADSGNLDHDTKKSNKNKTCHTGVADVIVSKITPDVKENRNKTISKVKNEEDFPTEISTPGETTTDISWATDKESKTIFSISVDVTSTTANPVKILPLNIEALLNIATQQEKDEDYEYDYNEPTLPPSLPNLRIIPFVAADALVKDKDDRQPSVTNYPVGDSPTESVFTDSASQGNRFSPPVETEGGFVPKDSLYYDHAYRSNGLNLAVGTGVTVGPQKPNNKSDSKSACLYEVREYAHSKVLPSRNVCLTCVCYYGKVICSEKECPLVKIGCRRMSDPANKCCGKIVCAKSEESPTVVLNRADAPESSQIQPLIPPVSPDPFRDVIKTEPAPDLPSLIEHMIPYFAITRAKSTSVETKKKNGMLSLDEEVETTKFTKPGAVEDSTSRYIEETTANASFSIMGPRRDATGTTNLPLTALDNEIRTAAVGLLKLAGCNIYGRMYRVGTIITELSSLCQECNCTQSGVLCNQLEC